jgi:hypothetical protein
VYTDTIKALFTYVTATAIALGGMIGIFLTRTEPGAGDTRVVLAGFVGTAIAFLFGQEIQTRTARQTSAATAAGSASGTARANEATAAATHENG